MLFEGREHAVDFEELDPTKRWFVARSFPRPPAGYKTEDIDPESGQPWCAYEGTALIGVDKTGLAEVKAVMTLPPESFALGRVFARRFGFRFDWVRYLGKRKRAAPCVV